MSQIREGQHFFEVGNGVPIHISKKGTIYSDRATGTAYINKNNLSQWNIFSDMAITGSTSNPYIVSGTYSNGTTTLYDNSGGTIVITGYYTGTTDIYVTGGTYSNGTAIFTNNTGGTFSVTGFLTGNTDVYVTGGTYSNGTAIFTNNTGGTFNVSGFKTSDIFVTGGTYTAGTTTFRNNTGGTFTITGFFTGATDVFTTGGSYSQSAATATFTNNTGGTFTVTGFYKGANVTGYTYNQNNNTFTISDSTGGTFSAAVNIISGLTIVNKLTSNTISATTLTANTIVNVDYIDFNTASTVTDKAGRLFYDLSNNALSYKPITPNTDVTLNIGQESFINIFNNTGVQINNGQAVHITGATSGAPSVTLAIATRNQSNFTIAGIATMNIPNNSFGFITTFGIVHDLNMSGFTLGETVYLSETVRGSFAPFSALTITGRTCIAGTVLKTGVNGDLLVSIKNENEITNNTLRELNIFTVNDASTGVFQFSGLTRVSSTLFSIAPAKGWIVDNVSTPTDPQINYIEYSGSTGMTTPYLTASTVTYVLLTSASTISLQSTFPTPQQRRQNIYLGRMGHPDKNAITNTFNATDSLIAPVSQLRDMFTPFPLINNGVVISPNGANLSINNSSGTLYGMGINFAVDGRNPNSLLVTASGVTSFQYRTQTGGTFSSTTLVDPANYDVAGIITSVGGGSNSSTNQRIYLLQNTTLRIQYGQTVYSSLSNAVAAAQTETYTVYPNFRDNAILVGILSINKNATNLSDISQAVFIPTSKFGEIGGGTLGISTTTLQQAYNNSAIPQITTSTALSAVTIQRGSAADTDILLQFRNASSAINATIDGNGLGTFKDFRINGTLRNGLTNTTTGTFSHAEGLQTTSVGNYSHAEGVNTSSNGLYSHAEGNGTQTNNDYSHSEGAQTQANGIASHAEGFNTSANASYSHSEGVSSVAFALYSHAEGAGGTVNAAATGGHAEGSGTTVNGIGSHSEGTYTLANGIASHAEGYQTMSIGNYSHTEGYSTTTNGTSSHAEGTGTTANGLGSHAEGIGTLTSGIASHTEGSGTTASGDYSHAEGSGSTSVGAASHAEGIGTITDGIGQHVEGRYNLTGFTNALMIIGNGTSNAARSNLALFYPTGITFNQPITATTISATTYYGNGGNLTGISLGIDSVLSVGQTLTTNRNINTSSNILTVFGTRALRTTGLKITGQTTDGDGFPAGITQYGRTATVANNQYSYGIQEYSFVTANSGFRGYLGVQSWPYITGGVPGTMFGKFAGYVTAFSSAPLWDGSLSGGSNQLPNLISLFSALQTQAGGILNAYDIYASEINTVGGTSLNPAVTNHYALYSEPFTYATNNYGIYINGPQSNYFGGRVGIGISSPLGLLHITAGTASIPPIILSSGVTTSAATNGAIEFDGIHFYGTVGSTRYQFDQSGIIVTAKTSNYNVTSGDTGKYFTNEGAAGTINFTLPTAITNLIYTFINQTGNQLNITSNSGDTIRITTNVTSSGGAISSTTIGSTATLVAINSTEWISTSTNGTWGF